MSVDALQHLRYPVVWTLRDMWAFTGGCHYTAGCDRYAIGCGRCPQLRSTEERDLSRRMWQHQQHAWRDMDLWLGPTSSWSADFLHHRHLFAHTHVQVLPTGIDPTSVTPPKPGATTP